MRVRVRRRRHRRRPPASARSLQWLQAQQERGRLGRRPAAAVAAAAVTAQALLQAPARVRRHTAGAAAAGRVSAMAAAVRWVPPAAAGAAAGVASLPRACGGAAPAVAPQRCHLQQCTAAAPAPAALWLCHSLTSCCSRSCRRRLPQLPQLREGGWLRVHGFCELKPGQSLAAPPPRALKRRWHARWNQEEITALDQSCNQSLRSVAPEARRPGSSPCQHAAPRSKTACALPAAAALAGRRAGRLGAC